jgi:hypothetical protein
MQPPPGIHNVVHWEETCRKIRARADDLFEERLGVIMAARAISSLAFSAQLRDDEDVLTFVAIASETDTLPLGEVREFWAPHALAKQDVDIEKAEALYRSPAREAAHRLMERLEWTFEARAKRRDAGHAS